MLADMAADMEVDKVANMVAVKKKYWPTWSRIWWLTWR